MDPDPACSCRGYLAGKVGSTGFSGINREEQHSPQSLNFNFSFRSAWGSWGIISLALYSTAG